MGYKPRHRPQHLAAKLLQIRRSLGLSQSELARRLSVGVNTPRLSEYESGTREPALITLLAYAYLIGIHVDDLIDDAVDLPARIKIKRHRKQITLHSS
jgi:transcriptional regulator with XRE-family HTH domain